MEVTEIASLFVHLDAGVPLSTGLTSAVGRPDRFARPCRRLSLGTAARTHLIFPTLALVSGAS